PRRATPGRRHRHRGPPGVLPLRDGQGGQRPRDLPPGQPVPRRLEGSRVRGLRPPPLGLARRQPRQVRQAHPLAWLPGALQPPRRGRQGGPAMTRKLPPPRVVARWANEVDAGKLAPLDLRCSPPSDVYTRPERAGFFGVKRNAVLAAWQDERLLGFL